MPKALVIIVGLLLGGCAWQQLEYTPRAVPEKSVAVELIERSLWEQYRDFAPQTVEVTSEYFRTSKGEVERGRRGFVTTAMTTVDSALTVYYDNIGSATLYKKDLYQVLIRAKSGEEIFRYYQVSEDKTKQFLDALETLRR